MARRERKFSLNNPQSDAMRLASDASWLFIIETLARSKESNIGVLQAMMSMVPDVSAKAPESTKEALASRLLHAFGGDAPAKLVSSCGAGVDGSGKETACPSLPKSKGGCESESAKKLKFHTSDGDRPQLQHSIALAPDSGDLILQEEPYGSEKHLLEQVISDGNKRNHLHMNDVITGGNNVHLSEQGSMCQQYAEGISHLNDGEARSPNLGAVPDLDNDNISLQTQLLPVQNVSDCDRRNDLQKDVINTGGNNVQFPRQNFQPQHPCKEIFSVQHVVLNGSNRNLNRPHQENDHFDDEPVIAQEISSDKSGSDSMPSGFDRDDEMFSAEKQQLLDSQFNFNHDSILGDQIEQSFCIKCTEGGHLLRCNANGCPVYVHESCLGKFKRKGTFYCPTCSYTRAAIAHCQAIKNVAQAKKDLYVFIGLVQAHRKKLPTAKSVGETSKVGGVGNENHQHSLNSHQYQRDKSGECTLNAKEKHQQTQAANTCNNDNLPSGLIEVPKSNHVEMVNEHNDCVQIHRNQPSDTAKVIDSRKLPCDDALRCSNGVTLIDGDGELGKDFRTVGVSEHQQLAEPHAGTDNCNVANEEVDAYSAVPVAKRKAKIISVSDHVHLPSGLIEVPKGNHVEMVNEHNGFVQILHNQPSDTAKVIDSRKLPCDDALTPPISSNDVTLIDGDGEVGKDCRTVGVSEHQQLAEPHAGTDNCNVAKEAVDAYSAVPDTKRKFKITSISDHVHLPKPISQEQINSAPYRDIDRDTSIQHPNDRHAKRRRVDTAAGKLHHPQENVESPNSRYGFRSRRFSQPKRHSKCAVALGRRRNLPWTPAEEEALKIGVEKFAGDKNAEIPWEKILVSGRGTFHRTRQRLDLKDKWRNIKKKKEVQGV